MVTPNPSAITTAAANIHVPRSSMGIVGDPKTTVMMTIPKPNTIIMGRQLMILLELILDVPPGKYCIQ